MPSTPADILAAVPKSLFIGGQWIAADASGTFSVEDPGTGETLTRIADAGTAEGLRAMDAAVKAQTAWARTAPRVRGELLYAAYQRMLADVEYLAALMTLEMGKSLEESRGEVRYAAEFLRWFSEEAVRIDGRYASAPDGASRMLTTRQPVGPCILVTPWNFPLAMGTRKIGPAFAAGCTVVVKPAGLTPLSMLALAKIFEDVGVPAGVLNVVTTSKSGPVVAAMMDHPGARKISFTGSTSVGRTLAEHGGRNLLRMSMELGGDNPFIVFEDADFDAAIDGAMLAKMRNIGEACTAANRFLVHSSIAEKFADALAKRMGAMTIGHGLSGAQIGPLIDAKARNKVQELVDDAIGRGARALTGGRLPDGPGYFYPPTVLVGVSADADISKEEIFGPVAPVQIFETEDEAIALANAADVGLTAYVYTRDLSKALRVFDRLETGMVGLNRGLVSNPAAPFGGVKASGMGREGGREGIDEYLEVKYAAIAL